MLATVYIHVCMATPYYNVKVPGEIYVYKCFNAFPIAVYNNWIVTTDARRRNSVVRS